jgi:hypothetical protein
MQNNSSRGIGFGVANPSAPGGNAPAPSVDAGLVLYILLLVPGVFFALLPFSLYPPVDRHQVMRILLGAYLLPWALFSFRLVRKRPGEGTRWLRATFAWSSLALVLLGILLLINGGLDRSPHSELQATVLRKVVLTGRHGTQQHILTVSSWRPGRKSEDLGVVSRVFDRIRVGQSVIVELHHGFFGLPWLGPISPN